MFLYENRTVHSVAHGWQDCAYGRFYATCVWTSPSKKGRLPILRFGTASWIFNIKHGEDTKNLAIMKFTYKSEILTIFSPTRFLYLQLWALCVYVLCVMGDLIKLLHIHQMDLGSIKCEQHRGAPTESPRFIYIQQYTEPQPTPKHTYTNHSRHVKLNLIQSTSVHEWMGVHPGVCL